MTRAALLAIVLAACGGKPAPGALGDKALDALTRMCTSWGEHVTSHADGDRVDAECVGERHVRLKYGAADRRLHELELIQVPSADLDVVQTHVIDDLLDADGRDAFRTMHVFVDRGALPGNATTAESPPDGYYFLFRSTDHTSLEWHHAGWTLRALRDSSGGNVIDLSDHR